METNKQRNFAGFGEEIPRYFVPVKVALFYYSVLSISVLTVLASGVFRILIRVSKADAEPSRYLRVLRYQYEFLLSKSLISDDDAIYFLSFEVFVWIWVVVGVVRLGYGIVDLKRVNVSSLLEARGVSPISLALGCIVMVISVYATLFGTKILAAMPIVRQMLHQANVFTGLEIFIFGAGVMIFVESFLMLWTLIAQRFGG